MLESNRASPAVNQQARSAIQFYSIEFMPLFNGLLGVDVMAPLCEDDGELASLDRGSQHAASLAEAFAVIRQSVAS